MDESHVKSTYLAHIATGSYQFLFYSQNVKKVKNGYGEGVIEIKFLELNVLLKSSCFNSYM